MGWNDKVDFALLEGVTLQSIAGCEAGSGEVIFTAEDGRNWRMHHEQDCCENVALNEVIGDVLDLVGSPILRAEEASSPEGEPKPEYHDSWTWTFYKLATIKGEVVLRWLGESNGYYSESVDFEVVQ